MISASYRMPHFKGLSRALNRAVDRVAHAVAKEAPREQARQIRKREKPDGSPQKRNAPGTIARKRHVMALRDLRVLEATKHYKITRLGHGYRVELPLGRRHVAGFLRRMGYDLWKVSPRLRAYAAKRLAGALDKLEWKAAEVKAFGGGRR